MERSLMEGPLRLIGQSKRNLGGFAEEMRIVQLTTSIYRTVYQTKMGMRWESKEESHEKIDERHASGAENSEMDVDHFGSDDLQQ
jgi:hypothetical protein